MDFLPTNRPFVFGTALNEQTYTSPTVFHLRRTVWPILSLTITREQCEKKNTSGNIPRLTQRNPTRGLGKAWQSKG